MATTIHNIDILREYLSGGIEIFFLPPYSPELNAQEYVNQDLKTNVIGKKRPVNKAQMKNIGHAGC